MTRTDWLLLALHFAEPKGLAPIQLQKALFLLGRELPKVVGCNFYNFEPYNYGPFDKAVFEDAKALAGDGFVTVVPATNTRPKEYRIAPLGTLRRNEVLDEAPARGVQYLQDVVRWIEDRPVQDLIRSIYRKYPEFKANSVLQE
jgi:hypothetical protein